MAAPTTFQDLPDDMLHEIFELVLSSADKISQPILAAHLPPEGAHLALRCVCRRWRDIADWVRLSTSHPIFVDTSRLADVGAVRARHPAAFKRLFLSCPTDPHSTSVSRAAASLINGSADLRRVLRELLLNSCCLPSFLPAVTTIASCTALTHLGLLWAGHKKERVPPSDMLAPLSALRLLGTLAYAQVPGYEGVPWSALLAPLPALPDAPRLTRFVIQLLGNFVPVGSDAALGRLRHVDFQHLVPLQELVDAEDPFLLRTAFDAGTWQSSRLTGLQELKVQMNPVRDSRAPMRPSPTGARSGSEWAPLAGQVTSLILKIKSDGYKRPSTGIVAGLGVLTALRRLRVVAVANFRAGLLEPMSIDRLRAPHLTYLVCHCSSTPANVAQFPDMVVLELASCTRQPPLNLRSLAARSSLKTLNVINRNRLLPGSLNLAELFVGGSSWPVLESLWLQNIVLEWDTTGLAGAPTAVEFAERARQLLPALVKVKINEPSGRNALPDRSRVGFVVACRRHVVPALLGLRAGGG